MKSKLILARIMFVVAGVVLTAGSFVVYRSAAPYRAASAEFDSLSGERTRVREQLVEVKLEQKAFSQSIKDIPDSTRMDQAGALNDMFNRQLKNIQVLTNRDLTLTKQIKRLDKKRGQSAQEVRRNATIAGAVLLGSLLAGTLLLRLSRGAFGA